MSALFTRTNAARRSTAPLIAWPPPLPDPIVAEAGKLDGVLELRRLHHSAGLVPLPHHPQQRAPETRFRQRVTEDPRPPVREGHPNHVAHRSERHHHLEHVARCALRRVSLDAPSATEVVHEHTFRAWR